MSGVSRRAAGSRRSRRRPAKEIDHDFSLALQQALPERGRIGIFNRSYYEEVLIVKVHPEFLSNATAPPARHEGHLDRRYRGIRSYQCYLGNNGIVVWKFFLNVSYKEQKRFLERIDKPDKNWKFSASDAKGAPPLEGLHAGVRGHDPRDVDRGAYVPCRQQVVTRVVVAPPYRGARIPRALDRGQRSAARRRRKALLAE